MERYLGPNTVRATTTRCWPSTTFLPSIGITCAPRMRSISDFFMAERHRERVRHRAAPDGAHQGFIVADHRQADLVFKLVIAASKTWRRLKGTNQLPKIIAGVRFNDGIEVIQVPANHAA